MLALVVLLGMTAACSTKTTTSGGGNDKGPPQRGGTLTVGLGAETNGWNPTSSQWSQPSYMVAQTIFDPLVSFGADHKIHPFLAKSITPNADYTQWTITLRPGITFQDGERLDAQAVKLQLDDDVKSLLVGQNFQWVKSVDVVGPLAVRVTTTQPWTSFPASLAGQGGFVAAPAQLNGSGPAATNHPIGTGPYTFKEWVHDDHLTVTRNPHYWRKDVAFPDTITFKVITDDQTRYASLQSGQIDLTDTAVSTVVSQADHNQSINKVERFVDPLAEIMLNLAVKPFNDLRVRQALLYATDQQDFIRRIQGGDGKVSTEPYLPGSPWYVPSGYPTKPDLPKARRLVDAYKRDQGITGPLKFTLGCTPTPSNAAAMKLLKSQWSKVGIDAQLNYTEQATYINNAIMGSYQANCWAQLGATDPDVDSIWWTSSNAHPPGQLAINFMRLKDPQIDQALATARQTADPAKRKAEYGKVWKRFTADLPYIWLPRSKIAVLWNGRVHGVGTGTLPDGSKPLLYSGEAPAVIPLWSVWVSK